MYSRVFLANMTEERPGDTAATGLRGVALSKNALAVMRDAPEEGRRKIEPLA